MLLVNGLGEKAHNNGGDEHYSEQDAAEVEVVDFADDVGDVTGLPTVGGAVCALPDEADHTHHQTHHQAHERTLGGEMMSSWQIYSFILCMTI